MTDDDRTARYLAQSLEEPYCLWSDEPQELVERVFSPWSLRNASLSVRWLNGKRMKFPEQVWDELDAALQFPWYFGRNWNAVIDCLRETAWEERSSYLLLIRFAEQVLIDDAPDGLNHLINVFSIVATQLGQEYQLSYDELLRPKPFHVLFHVDGLHSEEWRARLATVQRPVPKLPIRNPISWP